MAKSAAPDSLSEAGRSLWARITEKYELRADELAVLESACKTVDMIATLDKEWEALGKPFLTSGSMGQDVIHPLIGERRQQQAQLAALLGKLKLPDDPAATGAPVNAQREGGMSRWANAHGQGA